MKKFTLKMLTPEKTFFEGEVYSVVIKAPDGEMEILADHATVVVAIKPDMIRIKQDEEKFCANGKGFVTVQKNKVIILCQTLEWPEEIEYDRVQRAIDEHTEKLKSAANSTEYRISKMTIARALARLKVKEFIKDRNTDK